MREVGRHHLKHCFIVSKPCPAARWATEGERSQIAQTWTPGSCLRQARCRRAIRPAPTRAVFTSFPCTRECAPPVLSTPQQARPTWTTPVSGLLKSRRTALLHPDGPPIAAEGGR